MASLKGSPQSGDIFNVSSASDDGCSKSIPKYSQIRTCSSATITTEVTAVLEQNVDTNTMNKSAQKLFVENMNAKRDILYCVNLEKIANFTEKLFVHSSISLLQMTKMKKQRVKILIVMKLWINFWNKIDY